MVLTRMCYCDTTKVSRLALKINGRGKQECREWHQDPNCECECVWSRWWLSFSAIMIVWIMYKNVWISFSLYYILSCIPVCHRICSIHYTMWHKKSRYCKIPTHERDTHTPCSQRNLLYESPTVLLDVIPRVCEKSDSRCLSDENILSIFHVHLFMESIMYAHECLHTRGHEERPPETLHWRMIKFIRSLITKQWKHGNQQSTEG